MRKPTTTPYPFQEDALRRIQDFDGRCLVSMDMGLGKTFVSLLYAQRHSHLRPVIVVCPATIKQVWEEQLWQHFGGRCTVLSGVSPKKCKLKAGARAGKILVVNYDILHAWVDLLLDLKPQLVIGDEIHYTASQNSRRTRAMQHLCRDVEHLLFLSGTPITNRPADIYPSLKMLHPKRYKHYFPFAYRYCGLKRTAYGWDDRGATNLIDLHQELTSTCMLRIRSQDVLHDLPPKRRVVVPLEIERAKEYTLAVRDFRTWLKAQGACGESLDRANALVQLGHLKRLASQLKIQYAMDWIDEVLAEDPRIDNTGKIILFTAHRKILRTLEENYKDICVTLDGSSSEKARKNAVHRFQNDVGIRMFIGNIRAASAGITLTAANTVAFVEMDWCPGIHLQAEKRPHRIGTKHPVTCYYLVAKGTIEETLARVLQSKQETISAAIDGEFLEGELNVYDALLQELR